MRVKFSYGFVSHHGDYSQVHEVPDNITDEGLQQMVDEIVNDLVDAYYESLEEEGEV